MVSDKRGTFRLVHQRVPKMLQVSIMFQKGLIPHSTRTKLPASPPIVHSQVEIEMNCGLRVARRDCSMKGRPPIRTKR